MPHALTSPSPVVTNAVYKNDTEALRRLLYRVQNHGDTPPSSVAPPSSSPVAAYNKPVPPPPTNGYGGLSNGFPSAAPFAAYQQQPAMPPSTSLVPCQESG